MRGHELARSGSAFGVPPLDECTPYPADRKLAARGVRNTLRWMKRSLAAHGTSDASLFGIVQGSVYPELRQECAEALVKLDLPGYAIGGVSVGEGLELLNQTVSTTVPFLPADRPRYLMGVGLPEDLLESVERGMDMFDCVIPTRYARSATLFTRRGRIRISKRPYRRDFYPIDPTCACYACGHFKRAYIQHLYLSNEILGTILGAIHNVTFYQQLMVDARNAILHGRFRPFKAAFLEEYAG